MQSWLEFFLWLPWPWRQFWAWWLVLRWWLLLVLQFSWQRASSFRQAFWRPWLLSQQSLSSQLVFSSLPGL